jgi:hypothetical protein
MGRKMAMNMAKENEKGKSCPQYDAREVKKHTVKKPYSAVKN